MPEVAELELTIPPGFASAEHFRTLVSEALAGLEEKHQRELASQSRRFLGATRVLAQNPFSHPAPSEPRFALRPRIAARDKWRRIEGIFLVKTFLQEYRQAWRARRSGASNVQLPAGTYLLRIMHGVQ